MVSGSITLITIVYQLHLFEDHRYPRLITVRPMITNEGMKLKDYGNRDPCGDKCFRVTDENYTVITAVNLA